MNERSLGDEKLLKLKEAQEYLRVSRSTVLRMIAKGEIRSHKVGHGLRFYEKDLNEVVRFIDVNRAKSSETA
jgi:excisionase family DNA binding protein